MDLKNLKVIPSLHFYPPLPIHLGEMRRTVTVKSIRVPLVEDKMGVRFFIIEEMITWTRFERLLVSSQSFYPRVSPRRGARALLRRATVIGRGRRNEEAQ